MTAWSALLGLWLSLPPARAYKPPPPPWLTTNLRRLVTQPAWHLGLAAHTDLSGAAVTVQVSAL